MTESFVRKNSDPTNAAWEKLQQRLASEPKSLRWEQWAKEADNIKPSTAEAGDTESLQSIAISDNRPLPVLEPDRTTAETPIAHPFVRWIRRRSKRVAAVAVVLVLAAFLNTPIGNEALASILNKFRMQEMTVVQENELRMLLNSAFNDGQTKENINKLGTFTNTAGKIDGIIIANKASEVLGRSIVIPKDHPVEQEVYISPSKTITFKLNVDEVNKAMSRLGAKQTLPKSIDGKPITLETGETVNMNVKNGNGNGNYFLEQQPIPVVSVDPSIPVAEALQAVLQFPLLPDHLKDSLQNVDLLTTGNVPLPIITNRPTEKVKVGSTDVLIMTESTDKGQKYSALWINQGQFFELNSAYFTDREALLGKVKELIGP
ncbi:hypothetical protein SAMN04487970_1009136 [Paenibacillus tianmuensis]|uniref:DUF4367 domain-containing protein n=1 Tax=Paenibacillus tianmuensis TaxID=624147 RepID=A0A1G4QY00_9BACL|nr:hypothetical protein [Paenibacillus tianmuensis]SCW49298.1 hypothetical protein SAMN04487970_1009136 [Paenibacillus tianmuensis]